MAVPICELTLTLFIPLTLVMAPETAAGSPAETEAEIVARLSDADTSDVTEELSSLWSVAVTCPYAVKPATAYNEI